jgi:hypothetical protein
MSKKAWVVLGLVAGGLFLYKSSSASASATKPATKPAFGIQNRPFFAKLAFVGAREKVSAATYRMGSRRAGYLYVPARLLANGEIEFISPVAGFFTRVVVMDASGRRYAEIRRA